jgi:hypothetical protein
MKRLVKILWRWTSPVRRPFQTRLEAFLAGCLARALETQNPARVVADEVGLVLDAVVAEQFRLQEQLDDLRGMLAEMSAAPAPSETLSSPLSRACTPSQKATTAAHVMIGEEDR